MDDNSTKKLPLTPRMLQLVEWIDSYTRGRGYPPSMPEAAVALSIDRTRAQYLARQAVKRGALVNTPGTARSWRVVDASDGPEKRAARRGDTSGPQNLTATRRGGRKDGRRLST